ncbi:MAG: terminase small subunit [bacterium]|nr:terminase small subunit [bacterium]
MGKGKNERLTPKQQAFVQEYLVDLNATQACIRAGYSQRNADKIGSQLLGNPRVAAGIQQALKRRERRTEVTADRVLKELARLAMSDMRQLMSWGPEGVSLRESSELSDDAAAAVAEVAEVKTLHGGSLKLKLHSKERALELLARHLGLIVDRRELTGPGGGPILVKTWADLAVMADDDAAAGPEPHAGTGEGDPGTGPA